VFVVDSSGSIKSYNFATVKSFIGSVVDAFDISNRTTRVGLVQFSSRSVVEFDLRQYSSKGGVKRAIERMPYYGKGKQHFCGFSTKSHVIIIAMATH